MIIPIKCFTCGMVLADKYRYYREEVQRRKITKRDLNADLDINKIVYLTKEFSEKTPEGEVMDNLGLTRMCCRRHILTHVDID
jgi:DNA-directed RNA polymerase subunit N (RpoN/RPB10)